MDAAGRGLVLVAGLALLLAGCTTAVEPTDEAATPVEVATEFDPPREFGSEIWLGDGFFVDAFQVAGSILYTYRQGSSTLASWDLATGAERERVTIDLAGGAPRTGPYGRPFAFARLDGEVILLIAYEQFERGVGTQPDQNLLRVQGYRTDGSLLWSQDVPDAGVSQIRFVDISADHVVLVTGSADPATDPSSRGQPRLDGTTTVLAAATGEVRQVWQSFLGQALDRDVLAGLSIDPDAATDPARPAHLLQGRHLITGETVWEHTDAPATASDYFGRDLTVGFDRDLTAGAGRDMQGALLLPARSRGTPAAAAASRDTNQVLAIGTGQVLLEVDHGGAAVDCRYDGEQHLVCAADPADRSEPFLASYDLHSRTLLWDWEQVGAGRERPGPVSAVRRGVAYLAPPGPGRPAVVLDARTGDDLPAEAPLPLDQVGPGYGISFEDPGSLRIYPATG